MLKMGNRGENKSKGNTTVGKSNVKSVVFVPHTHGSSLAKVIREEEEMMERITG